MPDKPDLTKNWTKDGDVWVNKTAFTHRGPSGKEPPTSVPAGIRRSAEDAAVIESQRPKPKDEE